MPADDREQRRDAATFEHRLGQPLVHLERAGQPLELLAREPRRRAFVIATKGTSYGTPTTGKPSLFPSSTSADGTSREAEAEPEAEPREAVLREAAQVRALSGRELADAETRREQELTALEKGGRVVELGDVEPRHLVGQALRARRDAQA